MKRALLLALFLCGLAACASQPQPATGGVSSAQIQRLNSDYTVGRPRVSFAVFDGPEPLAAVERVHITAVLTTAENSAGASGDTVAATPYTDYQIPYWVVYPSLPTPGIWGLNARITLENGSEIQSQFLVEVKAESPSVPVGAAAPRSQNRTLATEPDLNKLSSGSDPNPALYQMTIADAARSGKPTVVAFATPGLCQTRWCTPVLDGVETVYAEKGEAANFIHVEVYQDFQELTLVPEVAEWGLETEPWVFVLDEDGRVAARFEGPLSPRELSETLQPLLP